MFYRIRIDLAFTTEDAIKDILDKTLDHLDQSLTINLNTINEERGFIIIEKCYHDEDPTKPCEVIKHIQTP